MPHVRTVKTAPGATALQIVYSSQRGSRELLKAVARQRLSAGRGELDLRGGH